MKLTAVLVALLLPVLGSAQGIDRGIVTTSKIDSRTAARYVYISLSGAAAATAVLGRVVYPYAAGGRLVDVIVYQYTNGVGGTSWSANVRKQDGTTLLTANATLTLAAGAYAATDAKGEMALPSGCTRPAIKTDAVPNVAKGEYVDVLITEAGSYSSHPTIAVVLVFEPKF